jgi:hypothetical protein
MIPITPTTTAKMITRTKLTISFIDTRMFFTIEHLLFTLSVFLITAIITLLTGDCKS